MNEELNLVEVLKDCPKGTKLYSPIFGVMELRNVHSSGKYPIVVSVVACGADSLRWFTADGRYDDLPHAECMLFPSRDNRDWSTFVMPKPLPKTWTEFCETHPRKEGDAYIGRDSNVCIFGITSKRNPESDKNVLPHKKYAEAMIALCQLIQLRDCYNDGWEVDYNDPYQTRFCIYLRNYKIYISLENDDRANDQHILTFKSRDIATQFFFNFKYLIVQAASLL